MSLTVLIVEDDNNFRKLLELRLKSWRKDVKITSAPNLATARKLLDEEVPAFELVILDQHLPDGMGPTLFSHPALSRSAVLAVSSDSAPELPARALVAGANHFLGKKQISEPLFIPMLEALLERKRLEAELMDHRLRESKMSTIKTLLGTLRHEINNPLGAVLGAAYLLRSSGELAEEQKEALRLLEDSGMRIKHVLEQLCKAAELEEVIKGQEHVYHVPGDPAWEGEVKDVKKK